MFMRLRLLSILVPALVLSDLALVSFSAGAQADPVKLTPVTVKNFKFPLALVAHQGRVVAIGRDGKPMALRADAGGALRLTPTQMPPHFGDNDRADIIPHASVARGGDIAEAWFAYPSDEYAHGALGDIIEAKGVCLVTSSGEEMSFRLPKGSVFEDLVPRIVDFDGDGQEDIFAVRSYEDAGAAITVLTRRDGKLQIMAEAAPVGISYRWLKPVGIGDFNGDGKQQIAYVQTSHIGGILKLLHRSGGDPKHLVASRVGYGFSNHRGGVPRLVMHAVLDWNGDGAPEIIVPRIGFRELAVIGFDAGEAVLRAVAVFDRAIVVPMVGGHIDDNESLDIAVGLADGRIAALLR